MGRRTRQLCFWLGTVLYVCSILVLLYTGFFCGVVYNALGLLILLGLGCLGIGISSLPHMAEKKYRDMVRSAARKGLLLYVAILAVMLFGMRYSSQGELSLFSWEYIRSRVNLIPLRSIWGNIAQHQWALFIVNCGLLFPVGVLLPTIWDKGKKPAVFFAGIVLISLGIEAAQVVTGLGSFDVDDLLLYLLGGGIGYCLWRAGAKRWDSAKKHGDNIPEREEVV